MVDFDSCASTVLYVLRTCTATHAQLTRCRGSPTLKVELSSKLVNQVVFVTLQANLSLISRRISISMAPKARQDWNKHKDEIIRLWKDHVPLKHIALRMKQSGLLDAS